jgi:hypothetical protein
MEKQYWLTLFTGTTWEEFLENGANTIGFKNTRLASVKRIKKGDFLICYISRVCRFIGVLEVQSDLYFDDKPIWASDVFPNRFKVKLIHKLEPISSIPVLTLSKKLLLFKNLKNPKIWAGFFQCSPTTFDPNDSKIIVNAIKDSIKNPIETSFDEIKYRPELQIKSSRNKKKVKIKNLINGKK